MAYNKFTKLIQLRKDFGINDLQVPWLPHTLPSITISNRLLDELQDAAFESLRTEKAKSEYVIAPVIKELRRKNIDKMSSFSGFEMEVDKSLGLTGFCDFILSLEPQKAEISAPIFCLVEAKKDDIERGTAQCGAEMYAASILNQQEGKPRDIIYGCVTNAFSWCFLKLQNKILYIDPNYVPLTFGKPHNVLAALQWILDESYRSSQ